MVEIPVAYENYGDVAWLEHGGLFSKEIREDVYHVILFDDMTRHVQLEEGETWVKVDDGYVDISHWDIEKELESHGFEDNSAISKGMIATIIFENHGALEFGEARDFPNKDDALKRLSNLFR